jgi:hypothetical protein
MMKYPKVLIVCSFNQSTANGITIKNIFRHWPKDKKAVADYQSSINGIYTEQIESYYILGNKESSFIKPFNLFISTGKSANYSLTSKPIIGSNINKNEKQLGDLFILKSKCYSLFTYLLQAFGLSLILKNIRVSDEFKQWVNAFNPDIIYVSTANIGTMRFAEQLKDEFNTKLVFHVFDDFLGTGNRSLFRFIRSPWLKYIDATYRSLLNKTDLNFAISEKMVESYKKKYNQTYYSFHNPIDEDVWLSDKIIVKKQSEANSFLFLYTGKINLDTASVLKSFLSAIKSLNMSGFKIKLHIYTQTSYSVVVSLLGVLPSETFKGFVKNDCLPEKLKEADGLLLPLSFSSKSVEYTRLSVATKATEYLVSKTPIFLFAPRELAVTEYLSKYNSAYIVYKQSSLQESIVEFIESKELRDQISKNAFNLAINRHLSKDITEKIRLLFLSTLNSNEMIDKANHKCR